MAIEIALGTIAALFFYMAFKLDDKHAVIKYVSAIFGVMMMLSIASFALNNQEICEIQLNYTNNVYVYGSNFTGYHWDYDYDLNPAQAPDYELFHIKQYNEYILVCFDSPSPGSGLTAFKLVNYFIRILIGYALIFAIYMLFQKMGMDLLKKAQEIFRK